MKMNKIYLAAAALLMLAACTKEIASTQACDITIDASIGAMTREIAVYAWTGSASSVPASRVVDGVLNTLGTDGKWTPASQMRWKPGEDAHYFLGVYPAPGAAITDFAAVPYTLDPADYEGSDLLIATNFGIGNAGLKSTGGAVPLNFDHAMAKLNVNLKFRSEFGAATPSVSGVTVTARKTAAVNYLTKTVTATASEAPAPVELPAAAAAAGYALSLSGLLVPQDGVTAITIRIGTDEYVYTSAADIPLESGKYTTLGLVVGKDKVELASVTVSDWAAGQDLPGGEAALVAGSYNGHAFVDMGEVEINGVKKHLKWATCNVGADNPWDYGDYYAWGETETYYEAGTAHNIRPTWKSGKRDGYNWLSYKWCNGAYNKLNKYCTYGEYWDRYNSAPMDNKKVLDPEDDVAHVKWGVKWRIPTDEEWTALLDDTLYDWVWTNDYLKDSSNHKGRIVTRKAATGSCSGNSIFLPAAGLRYNEYFGASSSGFYWSSSLDTPEPFNAWRVNFDSGDVRLRKDIRSDGLSVRPVTE